MSKFTKYFDEKNAVTPASTFTENKHYDNNKQTNHEHHTNALNLPATSSLIFQQSHY